MKQKNTIKEKPISKLSSVTFCMTMIGGKWKPIILICIAIGINRFTMLIKNIDGINKQMLSKQLKELETSGILERKIFPEIPPRVEYSLTVKGKSLMPVILAMNRWGQKHKETKMPTENQDSQQLPLF